MEESDFVGDIQHLGFSPDQIRIHKLPQTFAAKSKGPAIHVGSLGVAKSNELPGGLEILTPNAASQTPIQGATETEARHPPQVLGNIVDGIRQFRSEQYEQATPKTQPQRPQPPHKPKRVGLRLTPYTLNLTPYLAYDEH